MPRLRGVGLERLREIPIRPYRQLAAECGCRIRERWNTRSRHRPIAYYQTGSGAEIDFVIETRKRQPGAKPRVVCIEVKHAVQWKRQWERAMRDMAATAASRSNARSASIAAPGATDSARSRCSRSRTSCANCMPAGSFEHPIPLPQRSFDCERYHLC